MSAVLHDIWDRVSCKHGIHSNVMLSRLRFPRIVAARDEFFFRSLVETRFSLPYIARYCGRDHSTILYGAVKHAKKHGLPNPRGTEYNIDRKMENARYRAYADFVMRREIAA